MHFHQKTSPLKVTVKVIPNLIAKPFSSDPINTNSKSQRHELE